MIRDHLNYTANSTTLTDTIATVEIASVSGQFTRIATDATWRAADWVMPNWKQPTFDAVD